MADVIKSSTLEITVSAPQIVYSLSLSASRTSVVEGGTVTFNAVLSSVKPFREVLSGETVTLYENTTQSEGTATTNSEGIAEFNVTLPKTGTFSFVASFTDTSGAVTKSNTVSVTVTGTSPPPSPTYSVELSASTTDVTVGGEVLFTVTVKETSPEVEPINGSSVSLYVDGTEVTSGITASDGTVQLTHFFETEGTFSVYATATTPAGSKTSNKTTEYVTAPHTRSPPPPSSTVYPSTSTLTQRIGKINTDQFFRTL